MTFLIFLLVPTKKSQNSTVCPKKNVLIKQNHNQYWVLWGSILPLTWLGKDQKIHTKTQGVPANGDWASLLRLQQHSESGFFGDTLYCYTSTNDKFKTSKCLITKSCSILRQWQFLVVTHLLLFVNASPLWFCNFLVYFQLDISRLSKHHVLLKSIQSMQILRKIGYK